MEHNIDLDLYKIFFITASKGSISAAAKELYISQPAVSRSIKQLEDKLGAPLFLRKSRGVKLTENAVQLYDSISEIYSTLLRAEEKFLENTKGEKKQVRINATEIMIRHSLLPYLQIFSGFYPDVTIKLTCRSTPEALALLKSGQLDLALITMPAAESGNLKIRHLFTFHDCFVAGKPYEELRSTSMTLRQLLEYPLLIPTKGMNSRFYLDKICSTRGLNLNPHMEAESIDTLIQCALFGCGISFVIQELAQKEIDEDRIFQIPLKDKIESRSIGIATLNIPLQLHVENFIGGLVKFHRS